MRGRGRKRLDGEKAENDFREGYKGTAQNK